jgi:hypothetical protein
MRNANARKATTVGSGRITNDRLYSDEEFKDWE